jgi:flagellar hook assembly protein FlgD
MKKFRIITLLILTFLTSSSCENPHEEAGGVTIFPFTLKQNSFVKFEILNAYDKVIKVLINKELQAGSHSVSWDGRDANGSKVVEGIYFYTITINKKSTSKMLIMRN